MFRRSCAGAAFHDLDGIRRHVFKLDLDALPEVHRAGQAHCGVETGLDGQHVLDARLIDTEEHALHLLHQLREPVHDGLVCEHAPHPRRDEPPRKLEETAQLLLLVGRPRDERAAHGVHRLAYSAEIRETARRLLRLLRLVALPCARSEAKLEDPEGGLGGRHGWVRGWEHQREGVLGALPGFEADQVRGGEVRERRVHDLFQLNLLFLGAEGVVLLVQVLQSGHVDGLVLPGSGLLSPPLRLGQDEPLVEELGDGDADDESEDDGTSDEGADDGVHDYRQGLAHLLARQQEAGGADESGHGHLNDEVREVVERRSIGPEEALKGNEDEQHVLEEHDLCVLVVHKHGDEAEEKRPNEQHDAPVVFFRGELVVQEVIPAHDAETLARGALRALAQVDTRDGAEGDEADAVDDEVEDTARREVLVHLRAEEDLGAAAHGALAVGMLEVQEGLHTVKEDA